MFGRAPIFGTGPTPARGAWPVLLVLLAAALVPAGCVLWFMNAAMRNEQLGMRQRLADAYRQHLTIVRQRVEEQWAIRQAAIDRASALRPTDAFLDLVRSGIADSAVIFDGRGQVAYPIAADALVPPAVTPEEPWADAVDAEDAGPDSARAAALYARSAAATADPGAKARALQAQARCLSAAGDPAAALAVLGDLAGPEFRSARDDRGRLIAPAAMLFALRLTSPGPGRESLRDEWAGRIQDYSGPPMSSAQRIVLLSELSTLAGSPPPMLAPEELAVSCADLVRPQRGEPGVRGGPLPGVWTMRSADGQVVALFRRQTVRSVLNAASTPLPDGARVELYGPAEWTRAAEPFATVPLADPLPGWRLAMYLDHDDAAWADMRRRVAVYLWTGAAGVVAIATLTLAAGRYVNRQMTLARLKNDLIATVTHELKTPLASTRVLVDTLLESPPDDLPPRAREYLELIARENQRLSRLIDNFLTFSRMERSKQAFESAPVDVSGVVRAAVEAVGDRFQAPDERLEFDLEPDLPAVCGDRDALVTAVLNLLDNAHKYTARDKLVRLRLAASGPDVLITVDDNGIGLSRAACRRVFDRFYQVDRTLSRKTGGCGLGLAIVKFIVEAHGGSIDVESQVGIGTRFTIRLPAMTSPTTPQPEGEAAECPAAKPC